MVTRRVTARKRCAAANLVTRLDKQVSKLRKELLHCQIERLQRLEAFRDRVRDLEKLASPSGAPQPLPASAVLASEGPEKAKSVISVAARQSGIKGVCWQANKNAWRVQWRGKDAWRVQWRGKDAWRGQRGSKRETKYFCVHRYMESSGKGYEEADADALRDAIAFRESLVKDGAITVPRASHQSGIKGVNWVKNCWRVQIRVKGKSVHSGRFHPRDDTPEEIERARLAAVERRRQLELEHYQIQAKEAADPSEMQKKRESGVTGVTWTCHGLFWKANIRVRGKNIQKHFPPKNFSEEAVEAARLAAVRYQRDMKHRLRGNTETPS